MFRIKFEWQIIKICLKLNHHSIVSINAFQRSVFFHAFARSTMLFNSLLALLSYLSIRWVAIDTLSSSDTFRVLCFSITRLVICMSLCPTFAESCFLYIHTFCTQIYFYIYFMLMGVSWTGLDTVECVAISLGSAWCQSNFDWKQNEKLHSTQRLTQNQR